MRRRGWLAVILAMVLAAAAAGFVPGSGRAENTRGERILDFFARESVVCDSPTTATTLTASVYNPSSHPPRADFALIVIEGEAIRWSATGVVAAADNTATLAQVGDVIELHGQNNIRNFRCVYASLPQAHLRVQYAR